MWRKVWSKVICFKTFVTTQRTSVQRKGRATQGIIYTIQVASVQLYDWKFVWNTRQVKSLKKLQNWGDEALLDLNYMEWMAADTVLYSCSQYSYSSHLIVCNKAKHISCLPTCLKRHTASKQCKEGVKQRYLLQNLSHYTQNEYAVYRKV